MKKNFPFYVSQYDHKFQLAFYLPSLTFVTFLQDNQSIAHGESFQKVAKKCWETNPDQLVAVGVNCCAPSFVSNLVKGFNDDRPHDPIPLIVYPNSGEKYNPQIG